METMNKKTLTIGGIILVIIIIGVFFVMSNQGTQSPEPVSSVQNKGATPSPSASSTGSTSYTLADIAAHATVSDCWMAIEGKVYNVTDFVGKHPGGKAILRGCGKDATVLFTTRPDGPGTPHPPEAREILQQFYVGDLR